MQTNPTRNEGLYNTNGLPPFVEPLTVAQARERIAELSVAISSIEDQIHYREISGSLEAEWYRRASTSRRYKALEQHRLQSWIENRNDEAKGTRTLSDAVLEIIQHDYTPEEWEGILDEARALLHSQEGE